MEKEKKYQNVVELTNDWVWEVDEKITFTHLTESISDLLGYKP